tara:strand:- start:695 stop:1078 length:384 start_codon:yes stop_codon:yes gene_type:complete
MTVQYLPILINFLLGGFAVAGTSVLGSYMNPLAGAIFWSYPVTIIPSVFFMRESGKDNQYIAKFLFSTTFALGLLVISTMAMSYFIKGSDKDISLWAPIGKASLVYLVAALVFYLIIRFAGVEHYFM